MYNFLPGIIRPPSITKRGFTPFWFSTPYFSAVADALSSGVITHIDRDQLGFAVNFCKAVSMLIQSEHIVQAWNRMEK